MTISKEHYFSGFTGEGFHEVHYTEWGNASSPFPPIICIHGLARNRRDFTALANFLSEHERHVFSIDIAGRGDSTWFKNSKYYNFNQYMSDVNTLIARIDCEKVDLIGTSMGGLIGMMMAALPRSPINRLVMNDVGPQVPVKALWRLSKYIGKCPVFKDHGEAKAYFKTIYADFGIDREEDWDSLTASSIKQRADNQYIMKMDPEIKNAKHFTDFIKEFFHHPHRALEGILFDVDMWCVWEKVRCPVMVIRGHHSDLLLPEHIRKMKRYHQEIQLVTVENAGHAPALMNLREQQIILDWLEGG
ncbi:alpha/beta fold hydrolase [Legionella sp. 16cNR16C]|uniref:alpha/beta fold hydrolase n=1 Tax=Legionella sp. 16cNR16C TaxID=2905656 RepID=UPI001E3FD0DD|nr:alpha/beta hydrolase [Legionella sp. 16cNR16C]MCE3044950.1 alpha/beta hydrolase [Legionella sp. 16cNR16C]